MELDVGDKVKLIIGRETDLGFNVLINDSFEGLLYENEIFEPLCRNMKKDGYIKKRRLLLRKIELYLFRKNRIYSSKILYITNYDF